MHGTVIHGFFSVVTTRMTVKTARSDTHRQQVAWSRSYLLTYLLTYYHAAT